MYLFPVSCLLYHVSCIMSPVSRILSHVSCFLSRLLSPVLSLLSHIFCLTSSVSHLLSHISCLTSSVSRLLSHVSCLQLCLIVWPRSPLSSNLGFSVLNRVAGAAHFSHFRLRLGTNTNSGFGSYSY